MNVIAIVEYDNELPIAVVAIPEGKTADETFVMWYRSSGRSTYYANTDEQILELPFAWEELEVINVG